MAVSGKSKHMYYTDKYQRVFVPLPELSEGRELAANAKKKRNNK